MEKKSAEYYLLYREVLGRYFCIWRCQNEWYGPKEWGITVKEFLHRFYAL
jgi:hypothetical protein